MGSVVAGLVLVRYTIVPDMLERMTLASRVELLTQTRAEAVDAAAAELRRLERDLHDGAQARLVAIGLSLRALEKMIPLNPAAATALAVECRESSALALADLRDLVRGIYPPVLAERGLGDAVRALALDSPVKVATEIDLPGRPPAPVEAAVYFAVAEALSNVAKHADAAPDPGPRLPPRRDAARRGHRRRQRRCRPGARHRAGGDRAAAGRV